MWRLPDSHRAAILRCGKQFDGRLAKNRMAEFRHKFDQRNQDEAAVRQARMRNFNSTLLYHACFVEKNIEVDDPRPARYKLFAAKFTLDLLELIEQLARLERSFPFDNTIQKPRLREKIDRLSFIYRRAPQNSHADFRQSCHRALQIRGAIAEVRPERKINELAIRHTGE